MPNPSFEDTVVCPPGPGHVSDAVGWSSYRNSPDYMNSCGTNGINVPSNLWGYQFARTGNAYIGMAIFHSLIPNGREYIGIQLSDTLTVGQKYFASFYTSRAKQTISYLNVATNKIGMHLSTVAYSDTTPAPVSGVAQIFTDSIVTDTINWFRISGSFIADSAYHYLSIGNFFTDSLTSWISVDTVSVYSYYYVDDVILSTDSLYALGISETKQNDEFSIYPNPFNDELNIFTKEALTAEVIFYDITSRKIFNQSFTNSTSINTEQLAKGIYLYEVRNKNGVIKKGKVVKE